MYGGARDGTVVRALASHLCGPGSNPNVDAICGLNLLLVLSLAPRGFCPGTPPVIISPKKPTFPNSNSIWNARTRLNEFIRSSKCFVGKQNTIFLTIRAVHGTTFERNSSLGYHHVVWNGKKNIQAKKVYWFFAEIFG